MKILIIADLRESEIQNITGKLQGFQDEELVFLTGNLSDTLNIKNEIKDKLPFKTTELVYPIKRLSSFSRKLFIKSSDSEFNKKVEEALKNFKVYIGDYRPFIWRKEVNRHDSIDDVGAILRAARKPDIARYVLKIDVFNPDMRYLEAKKLKYYINRAFFRMDFPARKKKVFATQGFKVKQYQFGIDYVVGQLTSIPQISEEELVEKMNEDLVQFGIRALKLEIYSLNVKANTISDYFLSEIHTDFDFTQVQSAIEAFKQAESWPVKVKVPGMMRDSFVTIQINAKDHVKDIWVKQIEGITAIRMISEAPVSFYIVLPSMLKTSQKNIIRFPVRRIEFFKREEEGSLDIFDSICDECGEIIEKNPFDEAIDEHFCARHLPFDIDKGEHFAASITDEDNAADEEADSIEAADAVPLSTSHDIVDEQGEGDVLDDFSEEDEDDEPEDIG